MGKKSKGSSKKKQPKEVKDTLPEVDKEYYEIQIGDLNKKLLRLSTRCNDLENETDEVRKEMLKLDVDRADIIAHLKRTLANKMQEIIELNERVNGLNQAKEAERAMFLEKISTMESDFKIMNEQHIAEIKLLNGKLNSLEEFKAQKEELMNKFVIQEEAMEEQERRHKKTLYDEEKKYLISKDKLRQEMEARLLKLSLDFQRATQTRIAATTQSVIRENIAINNELTVLVGAWKNMFDENEELREKTRTLKIQVDIFKKEKEQALDHNVLQAQVIDRLSYEHCKLFSKYTEFGQYEKIIDSLSEELKRCECVKTEQEQRITVLERDVLKFKAIASEFKANKLSAEGRASILENIIRKAITILHQIIGLHEEEDLEAEDMQMVRTDLLKNLLEVLDAEGISTIDFNPSLSTIDFEERYEMGNLGIIPKENPSLEITPKESSSNL